MRQAGTIFFATVLGLSFIVSAQTASTQPAGRNAAGGGESRSAERGNRSRGQNFTATQMQRIQETLQATDDEWKVIAPRIEKIESLRRAIQNSRFGLRGRRGNPSGVPAPTVASPVTPSSPAAGDQTELQTASQQLQEALNNKNAQPQEIKARLAALREARAQALEEFTKSQDDLRDFLTARQEAVLVTLGVLN